MTSSKARLAFYRRFVYEKSVLIQEVEDRSKGPSEIRCAVTSELHPDGIRNKNRFHGAGAASFELSGVDRFRYRTRYFTDSGIMGTKEFSLWLHKQNTENGVRETILYSYIMLAPYPGNHRVCNLWENTFSVFCLPSGKPVEYPISFVAKGSR